MAQSVGKSASWIFEEAGGMRDQLEQAILNQLAKTKYPLQAAVKGVKAGKGLMGAIAGSKEQCVVIDAGDGYSINIVNTTVGTYLYVGVYMMTGTAGGSMTDRAQALAGALSREFASEIGDVFKLHNLDAYYAAALDATEAAFASLGLKQANRGYKRS